LAPVAIAAFGGIFFGYETGVAAGALQSASDAWSLGSWHLAVLSTGTLLGAMIGALASGKLADLVGRRDTIMATAAMFTLGAFASAVAPSLLVLFVARMIVGVAVGAISVAAPLYIAEVAPPARRGRLVCLFQLMITAGILLAYLGHAWLDATPEGWRYLLAAGAIPGLLLSGLALLLVESPLWLALQGDAEGAAAARARLGLDAAAVEPDAPETVPAGADALTAVFGLAGRRALLLGVAIFFFQQFVGINTVLYFAPASLGDLDFTPGIGAEGGSLLPVVIINFVMTLAAMALIDRIGRRRLVLSTTLGMAVALAVVAAGFGLASGGHAMGLVAAAAGIYAFVALFAVGIGPAGWVIVSEVLPLRFRGLALSLPVAMHWLFDGLVSPTSLILTDAFGRSALFAVYAAVALAGVLVLRRVLPETRGASLPAIDRRFVAWAAQVQDSRFVHYAVTTLAATGGMLTGFNFAITGGTLVLIAGQWNLDALQQGVLVSAIVVGLIVGSFLAGPMSDRFGRRYVLMSTATLFVAGAFGCALAPSLVPLVIARAAVGLAIGIMAPTTGLYVAEIAPTAIRGRLLSFDAVTYGIGAILAYGVSIAFEAQPEGWRLMFAVIAVPSTIYGLALLPLPESPRWLAATGQRSAARRVLLRLNEREVDALVEQLAAPAAAEERRGWSGLWSPRHRPAVILGVVLMFLLVFTGWDMVLFYAPTVLQQIGFADTTVSFIATLGLGVVFLVMTVFSLWIIDKVGRKTLIVTGLVVMSACLATMAALSGLDGSKDAAIRWAMVGCLAVFVGTFALTLGQVAEIVVSEIYPQAIRGPASSLSHGMRSLFAFVFSLTFPFMLELTGLTVTFLCYALLCIVGAAYLWRVMPETRGRSLEQIAAYWYGR